MSREKEIYPNQTFLQLPNREFVILSLEYWLYLKSPSKNQIINNFKVFLPPEEEDEFVSLGSQITVESSHDEYKVNIVGLPKLYPNLIPDSDNTSPNSPISQAIIGKKIGEIAILSTTQEKFTVTAIDQTIIQRFLKNILNQ